LGWPEQVTRAAKEHFLQASKIQSQMIDQAMNAWQQQLKTPQGRTNRSDPSTPGAVHRL
jgi:hypothetical protein